MQRTIVVFGVTPLGFWILFELAVWRAQVCLDARQPSQALEWLSGLDSACPNSARVQFLLGQTFRKLKRFREVPSRLKRAGDFGWNRQALQREQWLALAQTGQFDAMRQHWGSLFLDPQSDGPEIYQAFVIDSLNRFQIADARRVLAGWKADFPEDADPHFQEGRINAASLRWKDAEQAFLEAIRRTPARTDIHKGLAEACIKQLKITEAILHLQEWLVREPGNLDAKRSMAECQLRLGQLDTARRLLKEILNRHPNHYDALVGLGQLELAAARPEVAVESLERAVIIRPEDAEVRYLYARALRSLRQDEDATKHFEFREAANEPLLRLSRATMELVGNPDDLELRYEVAELTCRWKSRVEGEKWLRSLLERCPSHPKASALLIQTTSLASSPEHFSRSR